MTKIFSLVRFFVFLGMLLCNQHALSMIAEDEHDALGQWVWGSDYDDGQNGGDDPWAPWAEQSINQELDNLCNTLSNMKVTSQNHDDCITQEKNLIQHMRNFVKNHPQLIKTCTASAAGFCGFLQFMYIFFYLGNKYPENQSDISLHCDILLPFLCISIIPNILAHHYSKMTFIEYWQYYMAGMSLSTIYCAYCTYMDQKNLDNQFITLYKKLCQDPVPLGEFLQYFKNIPGITQNDLNDLVKRLQSESVNILEIAKYFRVRRY